MKFKQIILISCILLFSCQQKQSIKTTENKTVGVIEENAMVVSAHPLATKVGVDILKQGGNAYDAAAAVHFALAVVYPRAGNIGGGGFLVTRTANGEKYSLDFREKAPLSATKDMYLDKEGNIVSDLSTKGFLAVGVPGSVSGVVTFHDSFGALKWETVVQPAIDLAINGFELTQAEAEKLNDYQSEFLDENRGENMPFIKEENWQKGDIIKLPNLAKTLSRIQSLKNGGFYFGETADILSNEMAENNGLITKTDLEQYGAKWRLPLEGSFNEYNVISMPPPSSGGVALLQLLNGVELNKSKLGNHNDAKTIHLYTELQRRVYADRATYLGDTDFYDVPVDLITSKQYMKERSESINFKKATNSTEIKEGKVDLIESIETTHYSIVDEQGNAVAITTTLNGNYGSKVFIEELGFFLNNEMDDFSSKPGVPNMFGLVGAEANKIEPNKRMLSSMTPTIVEKDEELFMVVGTPGGSTIITSVFQTIMNVTQFNMTMQEAVNAKKTHHQWLPDRVLFETGSLTEKEQEKLISMGHQLEERAAIGRLDCILILEDGKKEGAADPRGDDYAMGY